MSARSPIRTAKRDAVLEHPYVRSAKPLRSPTKPEKAEKLMVVATTAITPIAAPVTTTSVSVPSKSKLLQYVILKGNNSKLVKDAMDRRPWWTEATSADSTFNFKWKDVSAGIHFEQLNRDPSVKQTINHFERNRELCTKPGLMMNLMAFLENKEMNVFDFVPVTFIVKPGTPSPNDGMGELQTWANQLAAKLAPPKVRPDRRLATTTTTTSSSPKKTRGGRSVSPPPARKGSKSAVVSTVVPTTETDTPSTSDEDSSAQAQTKVLSTPALQEIAAVVRERVRADAQAADAALQLSEVIASAACCPSVGYRPSAKKKKCTVRHVDMKQCEKNAWIVKPSSMNRGRGIELFGNTQEMIDWLNEHGKQHTFVVQKYLERPLLVHQRKFDMRLYALIRYPYDVFFYRDGYLRTSSEAFSLDNIGDRSVHLTNNAVQKDEPNYGKFEEGNQLDFERFQAYLDEYYPEYGVNFYRDLFPRMREIVLYSALSVRKSINPNDRKRSFELFGYDFMIDEDFKVWLIEVNTNPCLSLSSSILKKMLPDLIEDVVTLTVDEYFPPPPSSSTAGGVQKRIPEKFELLFSESMLTSSTTAHSSTDK